MSRGCFFILIVFHCRNKHVSSLALCLVFVCIVFGLSLFVLSCAAPWFCFVVVSSEESAKNTSNRVVPREHSGRFRQHKLRFVARLLSIRSDDDLFFSHPSSPSSLRYVRCNRVCFSSYAPCASILSISRTYRRLWLALDIDREPVAIRLLLLRPGDRTSQHRYRTLLLLCSFLTLDVSAAIS